MKNIQSFHFTKKDVKSFLRWIEWLLDANQPIKPHDMKTLMRLTSQINKEWEKEHNKALELNKRLSDLGV
jgi:hypothetical protein